MGSRIGRAAGETGDRRTKAAPMAPTPCANGRADDGALEAGAAHKRVANTAGTSKTPLKRHFGKCVHAAASRAKVARRRRKRPAERAERAETPRTVWARSGERRWVAEIARMAETAIAWRA